MRLPFAKTAKLKALRLAKEANEREEAERLAKTRGWSRSELYSNAVSAYIKSERFLGVREKLDAVYAQNGDDSAVDSLLANAQARSLPKEKW